MSDIGETNKVDGSLKTSFTNWSYHNDDGLCLCCVKSEKRPRVVHLRFQHSGSVKEPASYITIYVTGNIIELEETLLVFDGVDSLSDDSDWFAGELSK